MSKVKVLYVRNLKADVTEAELKEKFEPFGTVERVKKVKGYGFIHFTERDSALKAMQELNKTKIGDLEMEISLAKPLSKNKLRDKRKLQYRNWYSYGGYDNYWNQYPPVNRYGGRGRGARGAGRGNVDYYNAYDFSGDYFQQGYDSYNSYNNYYGYYGNNRYNNNNSYSNQRRGQHQQSYNADPNQQQWWMNGGYRNWNGNKGSRGMKHQPQQQQQAPR
jgi:RNA recognition motif-containing protein